MSKLKLVVALAGLAVASGAQGAVVGAGNSGAGWNGFMNVFNLPAPAGDGAFQFASGWGVADLNTSFNDLGETLTLSPNTIGDPNSYWYTPSGGPGAAGNKIMEANLYRQIDDGSLSGQTVNFQGTVISNTFTSAHVAKLFIRDFAPDFSSFNETIVPLTVGAFSINLNTDPGAGRHVQWGFQVKGVNVWATDTAPFGTAVISTAAVPAPGSLAVVGLGGLLAARRRRHA